MNICIQGFKLSSMSQTVVAGHTLELGKETSCVVRVYSRNNGILLASSQSNASGLYKIYLPIDTAYTIVAISRSKKYNAVIQDNVVPK